jgi:DNA-3-methyladenine glycosylase II
VIASFIPEAGFINHETMAQGIAYLSAVDPDLARLQLEMGSPPIWGREPGFPTLVHIILEQQVSLASALAAYRKLQQAIEIVTPAAFVQLNDDELRQFGFSRQKTAYCRGLALSILAHELDLEQLNTMDDASVRSTLLKIKGVGAWTADIYLLMALLRPDIWPSGDLALVLAMQKLKQLAQRPDAAEMERIAAPWRPWRAVATRLLWHYYLTAIRPGA